MRKSERILLKSHPARLVCAARIPPAIAPLAAMHNCSLISSISPGKNKHEFADQTLRALQAGPDHAAHSPGDGAPDPQSRGAARHGAEPPGGGLLRPARLRG